MREWLPVIERALQARGWSARHASMEAVDNANLISNMRRGKVPSVDRFRALCEVLGLEFYVGPPRAGRLLEEERLGVAVELAERALAASARELDHADKARLVVAVYELLGESRAAANAARVRELIDTVGGASASEGEQADNAARGDG